MTYAELLNPEDPFTTMKRDGSFDGNNDIPYMSPAHNPRCWSAPVYNPDGKVPVLNPEHYIHPLTGMYAKGPLDFSRQGPAVDDHPRARLLTLAREVRDHNIATRQHGY
jgi:hypothetical protein